MKLLFGFNIKNKTYNNQDIILVKRISEDTSNKINEYNKNLNKSNYFTKGIPFYLLGLTILSLGVFIISLIILIDKIITDTFDLNYYSYLIYVVSISFVLSILFLILDYSKYKIYSNNKKDFDKVKEKIENKINKELETPQEYEIIDILVPSYINENDNHIVKINKINKIEKYKIYIKENDLYLQNDYQLLKINVNQISKEKYITISYKINSSFNKQTLSEYQIRKYKIILDNQNNCFQTTGYYKLKFNKDNQDYYFLIPYYEEQILNEFLKD